MGHYLARLHHGLQPRDASPPGAVDENYGGRARFTLIPRNAYYWILDEVEVSYDVPRLAADFRREMADRGWSRTAVTDPEEAVRLVFTKGERRTTVTLLSGDGETEVWIESVPSGG